MYRNYFVLHNIGIYMHYCLNTEPTRAPDDMAARHYQIQQHGLSGRMLRCVRKSFEPPKAAPTMGIP